MWSALRHLIRSAARLRCDEPSHELIKASLKALAAMFDNDAVKIDVTVHNAARIFKVYGSLAAKGDSLPDRPHRTAHLLQVPEAAQVVSRELPPELKQFIDRVIVPALIKLYLSERNEGPKLAGRGPDVGESSRNTAALQGQEGP